MQNPLKKIFKPRLKLIRGTRLTSFLFIGTSIVIAAGILFAANIYYNLDTGEIVMEHVERVTQIVRATAGLIVGGGASQNPATGYNFQVVGNSLLETTGIASSSELRFMDADNSNYVAFKAPSVVSSNSIYTWPASYPSGDGYVLSSTVGGTLSWISPGQAGLGDVTAVGDCASGECFTATSTSGQNLWFYTGGGARVKLTAASTASERTITLPAADGTVALGTGTTNYVAYWTGTNTLGAEQYLSNTRGGTGANSSGWNGMVRVVGGSWGAVNSTAGYVAYWSDANTVSGEAQLATSRGGTGQNSSGWTGVAVVNSGVWSASSTLSVGFGGTGRSSWTQWGVVFADTAGSLTNTAVGTNYQILTSSGGSPGPTWRNIADLITVTNGLTGSGTTNLTLKLGGLLTETTTITPTSTYDLIINLAGTGDFKVQDSGSDVFIVSDDGRIWFKQANTGYPIAQTGKQVLREVVPIFGFDLPVRTTTTTYATTTRIIVSYPLNPCESGTSRVHKLVIRYGATATSSWQVATSSGAYTTFQLPPTTATSSGSVFTATTSIPTPSGSCTSWTQGTDTADWWVKTKLDSAGEIMIYQIFLAGYDEII